MSAALDTMTDAELAELRQMQSDDAASTLEQEPETPAPAEPETPPAEPASPATPEPAQPEEPKLVDKRALDQERDRRKKLEAALAEQNAKHAADLARTQERLDLLMRTAQAAVTPAPVAPTAAPDPQQDPLGYVQHVTQDLNRQIGELKQQVANTDGVNRQVMEAQLANAQVAELRNWAYGQEVEAAKEVPDYADAMGYLKNTRLQQLTELGYSGADVERMMQQDVTAMAMRARETGKNFGQMLYGMARATGYQQKAAPAAAPSALAQVNGGAPAAPTPNQRVATAMRGAEMSTSLGAAGTAPRGELTPQALAEMSDADFSAMLAKMGSGGMKQLFGD